MLRDRADIVREVREYLRENIKGFDNKVARAWRRIDETRAPLRMVDDSLNDKILELAAEWFEEEFGDAEEFI